MSKLLDYKIIEASEAEATCWHGSFKIEVNNKQYSVGIEIETVGGTTTLYTEELDEDNIDLDFNELEKIGEIAVMQSAQEAIKVKQKAS